MSKKKKKTFLKERKLSLIIISLKDLFKTWYISNLLEMVQTNSIISFTFSLLSGNSIHILMKVLILSKQLYYILSF